MRRAASLVLLLVMVGCAAPIAPVSDTASDVQRRRPHPAPPAAGTSLPSSTVSRLDEIARKVRELRDRSPALGD